MMKTIAFVPVRGGSKSIPLKNIKSFCGKPLVYWGLKALEDADDVDEIFLATDSDEISEVVENFNFKKVSVYKRKPENAQDTSSTESVILEFLNGKKFPNDTIFILLQATSPFTTADHIASAIKELKNSGQDSLLTAIRIKNFFWNENGQPLNYDYKNRPRRQDFNGMFKENGAFYINSVGNILEYKNRLSGKIIIYEMPEYTGFEIDEPDDWIICEELMYRYNLKNRNKKNEIKLFLTDVDGVLTDAGMYYTESGDEIKKFNTLDGKAFELLRNKGIKTGIITSEKTRIVENRAKKIKTDYLFQGISDKLNKAKEVCEKEKISLSQVAYIGDDINDTELLSAVGFAAVPQNGVEINKNIPGIIHLNSCGGDGAVREFVEILISND